MNKIEEFKNLIGALEKAEADIIPNDDAEQHYFHEVSRIVVKIKEVLELIDNDEDYSRSDRY